MKKTTLIVILVLTAMLMQYCNKDSISQTATSTSTVPVEAFVNDTTWTPTTYNFALTYTAATTTKVFSFTGVMGTQQLKFTMTVPNSTADNSFPITTYNVDASGKLAFTYGVLNSSNVFVPQGTTNTGYLTITAIDQVNNTITGTFGFGTIQKIYDTKGNLISIYSNTIESGEFNAIPFTFKSN